MKLVIAYINPHTLDAVRDALREVGVSGMSAGQIQGFGRQGGHTETYRGAEYEVQFVPKIRVEVLTSEEQTPAVVSAIERSARSGATGDGKIAILAVEDVIRIRTGERGRDAL